MPFGFYNALATFQRLIDRFRRGLTHVTMFAYLDDLIIVSSSFKAHLQDLHDVFKRLGDFKLCVNRQKYHFLQTKVKYLKHILTREGIQTNPDKVKFIMDMAPPGNLKEVQIFLQTCSWYQRFVPNFANVSRPLSLLTKKPHCVGMGRRTAD